MSKVLTISGQKGGIGKSVIAVNLAFSLALYEKKILLIDCDPLGCSTEWSGVNEMSYPADIASVFDGRTGFVNAVVNTQFPWLDILPAGFGLFASSLKLSKMTPNETLLRLFIREDVYLDYDYILIDGPSSSGYLSIAALAAADWVIAPICPGQNSLLDFHCLLKLVKYVRLTHEIPLKIGGFVFNRCGGEGEIRSFLTRHKMEEIEDLVYDTCIPDDMSVAQAVEKKTPLALDNIKSPAAKAFLDFAKEIDLVFK